MGIRMIAVQVALAFVLFMENSYADHNLDIEADKSTNALLDLYTWESDKVKWQLFDALEANLIMIDLVSSNSWVSNDREMENEFSESVHKLIDEQNQLVFLAKQLRHFSETQNHDFDTLINRSTLMNREFSQTTEIGVTVPAKTMLNRMIYFSIVKGFHRAS